ncbi:Uncharacterized protein conserved in bacteria [Anaerotruncus sp. 2789STDY5834896]|uniref:Uncharacterized protein conserved in bacteria n=1 Tax=uncultured Anaerotruncus sp. TaxID=905011 RepID=A0A1C6H7L4_9FIRM|nr:Uncharacterized protein conserved in bacteria [uncultured Anaerotruncus sp.]
MPTEHQNKPVEFTPAMREDYTILVPMMLPIHFEMIVQILRESGYRAELLRTTGRRLVDEGLKNVHNDTCYPALLVIGQMIDALKSGQYDVNKTALLITQTGGGCRASNYIYLLRKALRQSGFPQVPVISINFTDLAGGTGFKITPKMLIKIVYAMIYGDMLMWLRNQCKPYELKKGQTDKVVDRWIKIMNRQFSSGKFLRVGHNYREILEDFAAIERHREKKIKVGIVGEIYMKYAPLGNNDLENFLIKEGAQPVVSGVLDFCLYCLKNGIIDYKLYGGTKGGKTIKTLSLRYCQHWQNQMIRAIKKHGVFTAPTPFAELEAAVDGFIGKGAKMGEGWLLTAEMLELIQSGVNNVVCTQPFGCLPNHIIAKGMMRKIKNKYPQANIVAVDYDPSATPINQENRLKLMLSNARLTEEFGAAPAAGKPKPILDKTEPAAAIPAERDQRETVTL